MTTNVSNEGKDSCTGGSACLFLEGNSGSAIMETPGGESIQVSVQTYHVSPNASVNTQRHNCTHSAPLGS